MFLSRHVAPQDLASLQGALTDLQSCVNEAQQAGSEHLLLASSGCLK